MIQSHLILTNAAIIWVARVLLLVPQLAMVPFLIHSMGDIGYGVYALVWPLMTSIDQLQQSLQSGVVKYCAGSFAQGRVDEVNKTISSSFVYSVLLAGVACVGTVFVSSLYGGSDGDTGAALAVVGIMVLFVLPLTPYVAVIQSRQRYFVSTIADTLSKYTGFFAIVIWFDIVGPSVKALVIIMAGALFLSRLVQVPIAYRLVRGLRNPLGAFDWRAYRQIACFGAATVLASVCLAINTTGIRWLMDSLVSTSFVAHLAIMLMPAVLLSQVLGAMTVTVMPATSAYEATGNQRILQKLLIRGMRYMTILALAALIAAALLTRNALNIWLGPEYVFLAPYAIALLASAAFMQSTSISHHMLKGMGKLSIVVFIYAFGLAVLPIGLIFLVLHATGNAYAAATIGLVVGQLVCGSLQVGFCAKAVHADVRTVVMRAHLQPAIVAVVVCLVGLEVVSVGGVDGLLGRACVAVLSVFVFLGGCYAFIGLTTERQQIKRLFQHVKRVIALDRRIPKTD